MGTATLVRFKDLLEENATEHFGILFENGFIVCLCCGGSVEPNDYEIVEKHKPDDWPYVDETLKNFF